VLRLTAVLYVLSLVRCASAAVQQAPCVERSCAGCCAARTAIEAPATPSEGCCDNACACCLAWVTAGRDEAVLLSDALRADTGPTPVAAPALGLARPASATYWHLPQYHLLARLTPHRSPSHTRAPPLPSC